MLFVNKLWVFFLGELYRGAGLDDPVAKTQSRLRLFLSPPPSECVPITQTMQCGLDEILSPLTSKSILHVGSSRLRYDLQCRSPHLKKNWHLWLWVALLIYHRAGEGLESYWWFCTLSSPLSVPCVCSWSIRCKFCSKTWHSSGNNQ